MAAESTISEADRRAAREVTTSRSGHRFEIQLGNLCNNRCVFCSSGQMTALKIARPVALEPILEALEQARAEGATHLTFVGGEPTIHKRFLEALAKAVELGFEHIVIFTNGVMFPHPGFIDSVTALGRFEWRISIQGATEEAHVGTTGRADSFERIVHGLGELQRKGQLVTANMCVNERSFRSLPAYPDLLSRYGVCQLHVDIVRPESTGGRDEAYLREIMPRYSSMAPYYAAMLEGFERTMPDFDINVGNLPHCILPEWGAYIHHGGEETVTRSSDADGLENVMDKHAWQSSLRTHLPGCAECVFRSRCTGIFRAYLELHGGDEFRPVSSVQLAERDPQRRNFVLFLEPRVVALKTAPPPPGWELVACATEDRCARLDLTFGHESGGRAMLRWIRPQRPDARDAVIVTGDYAVAADADLDVPADAVARLLKWTASSLGEEACAGLREDAGAIAFRRALLARGRQRVVAMARRLVAGFRRPGWTLSGPEWLGDERAELPIRGPYGAEIRLAFTLGAREGRSQVDVGLGSTSGCDASTAREVIGLLTSLLRSAQSAVSRS